MLHHPSSRDQNRNQQTKAWKQTLLITKRQIQSNEKDLPKLFAFSNTIHEYNQVVNKMLKQYQKKQQILQKQQKKVFGKLNDLYSGINDLKQTLKYYQHTNEYLVKVQNSSQGIYSKIQKIKESMSNEFQTLLENQESIQNDLKLYDHKVQLILAGDYEDTTNNNKKMVDNFVSSSNNNKQNRRVQSAAKRPSVTNIKPNQNSVQNNNPNMNRQIALRETLQRIIERIKITQGQVQSLQQKITNLGKNLGWNQQDHNDFIKIWNRCQGKNYFQIEQQLIQYFKLYTQEQIRDHMNKHLKYKQLNQQKKQKILEYKQYRQQKKIKQFEILSLEQQKRKKIQTKQKNYKKSEEQQHLMKQKVQEWKKAKEQKKRKQQEQKLEEEQRKRYEKQRRIQQNLLRKQVVQKWKQQQQEIKTKKMKQSQATKVPQIDKDTQERIRQRQQKLIAQKVQKVMKKKYQQQQKMQKEQKLKEQKFIKYSYVNSKLDQKTTAIKQKQRQKFDGKNKKDANTFGGNLLHMGIRATPTWMQGL